MGRLSLSLCESHAAQQLRLRHLPLFLHLRRRAGIPLRRLLTQSANLVEVEEVRASSAHQSFRSFRDTVFEGVSSDSAPVQLDFPLS